jgi:two-component system heavy metal sensor histidine kinase CusS
VSAEPPTESRAGARRAHGHGPSLTLRLSLLFAAASTVVLLALGQFIVRSVDAHFVELDLDLAQSKLALVRSAVSTSVDARALAARLQALAADHDDLALRVRGPDGRDVYASPGAPDAPPSPIRVAGWPRPAPWHSGMHRDPAHANPLPSTIDTGGAGANPPLPVTWTADGRSWRGVIARAVNDRSREQLDAVLEVTVGIDTAHHDHYLAATRRAVWTFVAAAMLAMGLLGFIAARSGLAPLRRIARAAAGVSASRFDLDLDDRALPPEAAELAAQLEAMLGRLRLAFDRLSALSTDLAHELRTPVSALVTQTQVTLAREREATDYRDALVANAEALDRLSRMIADMLLLARAEHGGDALQTSRSDLRDIAQQVAAFHEAAAAERDLSIGMAVSPALADTHATVDPGLAARAISNLLSNAIRHARPGSVIDVVVGPVGHSMRVAVRNAGEPLPPAVLERMFDRFWRADEARTRDGQGGESGLGLGLAIVRSIAQAHGGRAGAQSLPPTTAGVGPRLEVWFEVPADRIDRQAIGGFGSIRTSR